MFKKEATTLRRHSAFISSNAVFGFDKIDIGNNVVLGELGRRNMVEMSKNKPHFLKVIPSRTRRIPFCIEVIGQL